MNPTRLLAALALLATGYVWGAYGQAPAQAHDSAKLEDLLRDIARAESGQAESLRTIARSSERCSK